MRQEWRRLAKCTEMDPDAPFVAEDTAEERLFIRTACGECPVTAECLEWALRYDDHGVAGGLNRSQRRKVLREREGRPCGTDAGYFRHRRRQEAVCADCTAAHTAAVVAAARKARKRRGPRLIARVAPTDTGACGTGKGYQRHHARGENACDRCTAAKSEQTRQYKTKTA